MQFDDTNNQDQSQVNQGAEEVSTQDTDQQGDSGQIPENAEGVSLGDAPQQSSQEQQDESPSERAWREKLEEANKKYASASQAIYRERLNARRIAEENQRLRSLTQQGGSAQAQQGAWYEHPDATKWDVVTLGRNLDSHVQRMVDARFESVLNTMLQKENERAENETKAQTMARVADVITESQREFNLTPQEVNELIADAQENPHEFLRGYVRFKFGDRVKHVNSAKVEADIARNMARNAKPVIQQSSGSVSADAPKDGRSALDKLFGI